MNRLSNKLEDLLLCARLRVHTLPRWVVEHESKVWLDDCDMPTFNQARKLLAKLG